MNKNKWINRIHQGDVTEVLKQMPSNFVDTVITSPPYWSLRNYGEEVKNIFGGDPNCEHVWEDNVPPRGNKSGKHGPKSIVGAKMKVGQDTARRGSGSNFCSKCGAWQGQIGLEPHPQMFIDHLVMICREIKRVLKKSGSFYLNLGDTYYGSGGAGGDYNNGGLREGQLRYKQNKSHKSNWLKPKQLLGIPWRVAIALQDDGWILRNTIIWHKPNPMPSSVKDRLNNTYEYVFHLVQSKKYYYDLDAIRVPHKTHENRPHGIVRNRLYNYDSKLNKIRGLKSGKPNIGQQQYHSGNIKYNIKGSNPGDVFRNKIVKNIGGMRQAPEPNEPNAFHQGGKNPGDIFDIPTHPFLDAHFAVFPKSLVEIPIKASCPQFVCKKCGKPRERLLEKTGRIQQHWAPGTDKKTEQAKGKHGATSTLVTGYKFNYKTTGWSDCGCNADFGPGILLDPFCGSGTACLVAKQMSRRYIGIDLNPEYVKMARKRLALSASVHDWLDNNTTPDDGEWKWNI